MWYFYFQFKKPKKKTQKTPPKCKFAYFELKCPVVTITWFGVICIIPNAKPQMHTKIKLMLEGPETNLIVWIKEVWVSVATKTRSDKD